MPEPHNHRESAPTRGGFWTTWFPGALPQCWPFGWWVAVVIDRYSRRALAVERFANQPTSSEVRELLRRTMQRERARPRTIICDRGRQFDCGGFRLFCRRRRIEVRYGAVVRHGSIALVE